MKSDCYVNIYIYPAWLSRPRESALPAPPVLRAPLKFLSGPLDSERSLWDCSIRIPRLHYGGSFRMLPARFVSPEFVVPRISAGTRFLIWRYGFIGQGEVAQVVSWAKYAP